MKKLKKLASGLSYSEVRARQDKSPDETDRDVIPAQGVGEDTSEVQMLSPASVDHVPDPISFGESSTVPASPATAASSSAPSRVETEERVSVEVAEQPEPPFKPTPPASRQPVEAAGRNAFEGRMTLKGYVARPVFGVSKSYDEVVERYGEKAGMTYLLDAAIKAFEDALVAGDVKAVETNPAYVALPKKSQTMRSLSAPAYRLILEKIDPLNILRAGTVGTCVLQAAVNRFVANAPGEGRPDG